LSLEQKINITFSKPHKKDRKDRWSHFKRILL